MNHLVLATLEPLSFGIELEFIAIGQSNNSGRREVLRLLQTLGISATSPYAQYNIDEEGRFVPADSYLANPNYLSWHVSADGSVKGELGPVGGRFCESVEISSPICYGFRVGQADQDTIRAICLSLRGHLNLQLPSSAGLHVHVGLGASHESFSDQLLRRIFLTMYILEPALVELICPPWRRSEDDNPHFTRIRGCFDHWLENRDLSPPDANGITVIEEETFVDFMDRESLVIISGETRTKLRLLWELDGSDLREAFGQYDFHKPLVFLNESCATCEFRYCAGSLSPSQIVANADLFLAIVDVCKRALPSQTIANSKEQLQQLLTDVIKASMISKDLQLAGRRMVEVLCLERHQSVWEEAMSEARQELETRQEGIAPTLGPLED